MRGFAIGKGGVTSRSFSKRTNCFVTDSFHKAQSVSGAQSFPVLRLPFAPANTRRNHADLLVPPLRKQLHLMCNEVHASSVEQFCSDPDCSIRLPCSCEWFMVALLEAQGD